MTILTKIKNAFIRTVNASLTPLAVIATIAITWYICTYYNANLPWWGILTLVGIIGLSSYLPTLANRFKGIWSITATGLTLLMLQTVVKHFCLTTNAKFWTLAAITWLIALFTEFLAERSLETLHLAEIAFDAAIAILAAKLIVMASHPIITIFLLEAAFCTTLYLNFFCGFSIKRKHTDTEN